MLINLPEEVTVLETIVDEVVDTKGEGPGVAVEGAGVEEAAGAVEEVEEAALATVC